MSHMFFFSRPITLFSVVIAATEVYSTIKEIQSEDYKFSKSIGNMGYLFTTKSQSYEIKVFGDLFGKSNEILEYSAIIDNLEGFSNEIVDYYELSMRNTLDAEILSIVIGCSKEWKSLPISKFTSVAVIPLGVPEGCRIFILEDEKYPMKITKIDQSMPEMVKLYLEIDDRELALNIGLIVSPKRTDRVGSCQTIDPPVLGFRAFDYFHNDLDNLADLPIVAVGPMEEEPESIGVSVSYKGQLMLSMTVKCAPITAPLKWIYSFKFGDLYCFAISEIPQEQRHLVDRFALAPVEHTVGLGIYFAFRDSEIQPQPFDVIIGLLADGCPPIAPAIEQPIIADTGSPDDTGDSINTVETDDGSSDESAEDSAEIDLGKFSLTDLSFGSISAYGMDYGKSSLGPYFPKFPGAKAHNFIMSSFISAPTREVVERVVVQYVKSPSANVPDNSMILVLSVLEENDKASPKYVDRLAVLITCSENDMSDGPNTIPFGKNCVIRSDFIPPSKLTLTDSGRKTHNNLDIAEFNIKDEQGHYEFTWRISNNVLSDPNKNNNNVGDEQIQPVGPKPMAEPPTVTEQNEPRAPLTMRPPAPKQPTTPIEAQNGQTNKAGGHIGRNIEPIGKAQQDDSPAKQTVPTDTNRVGENGGYEPRPPAIKPNPTATSTEPRKGETLAQKQREQKKTTRETKKRQGKTRTHQGTASMATPSIQEPTSTKLDHNPESADQTSPAKTAPSSPSTDASTAASSATPKKNAIINWSPSLTLVVAIVAAATWI